jgi:hypothetical protein
MILRYHPLIAYRGCYLWPPEWVCLEWPKQEILRGEIGFLKEVLYDPIGVGAYC